MNIVVNGLAFYRAFDAHRLGMVEIRDFGRLASGGADYCYG